MAFIAVASATIAALAATALAALMAFHRMCSDLACRRKTRKASEGVAVHARLLIVNFVPTEQLLRGAAAGKKNEKKKKFSLQVQKVQKSGPQVQSKNRVSGGEVQKVQKSSGQLAQRENFTPKKNSPGRRTPKLLDLLDL
jgi:hypothetical protein